MEIKIKNKITVKRLCEMFDDLLSLEVHSDMNKMKARILFKRTLIIMTRGEEDIPTFLNKDLYKMKGDMRGTIGVLVHELVHAAVGYGYGLNPVGISARGLIIKFNKEYYFVKSKDKVAVKHSKGMRGIYYGVPGSIALKDYETWRKIFFAPILFEKMMFDEAPCKMTQLKRFIVNKEKNKLRPLWSITKGTDEYVARILENSTEEGGEKSDAIIKQFVLDSNYIRAGNKEHPSARVISYFDLFNPVKSKKKP